MKRVLVWDVPTRLFHWLLAIAFLAAFLIASTVDDEQPIFAVHSLLGLVILFMVALRVLWGFVGTRHARFASFVHGPGALLAYLRGVVTGKGQRYVGHNPGSSLAIFLILALVVGLGVTGVLMSGGGEAFEEVHEVLAYTLLGVVVLHVAGVAWHAVRHRDGIVASMVHGHKVADAAEGIPTGRPLLGVAFLVLVGAWSWGLAGSYDAATRQVTLPLLGQTITLGEGEEDEHQGGEHEEHEEEGD